MSHPSRGGACQHKGTAEMRQEERRKKEEEEDLLTVNKE